MKILAGKPSSSQVNKVQEEKTDPRLCSFCGKKGHENKQKTYNDLRKAGCLSFGKKCKNCGFKCVFRKKGEKKEETPHDSKKLTVGAFWKLGLQRRKSSYPRS